MKNIMFETDRCIVRTFEEKDITLLMNYRNNSEWMKYQGFKNKTKNEYQEVLLVEYDIEKGVQVAFCSKENDKLLGDLYLHKEDSEINIGYTIDPIHSKQGLTFEVLQGLLHYLQTEYPHHSIVADFEKDNTASKKLLMKLGFDFVKEDSECIYYRLR